jgi:probable F420-dependent oxidoreductase
MKAGNTPCGINIPQDLLGQSAGMQPIRKFVTRAEALGYDSLWVTESIIGKTLVLEPVTFLSYVAALTEKIRLGVAVMLLTLRNPVQLAKSLATLDLMSNGRLDPGFGIGGYRPEEIFGYSSEHRVRRFEEALQVMKALWTQSEASFSGAYWNFEGVSIRPKPVQQPHPPIWFGARVPAALRRASRYGDAFIGAGSSSIEDFITQSGLIRQYLGEEGRDPETFNISKRVYLAIDPDHEGAEKRLREWFGHFYGKPDMAPRVSIWGSRDECLDKLGVLVQAGAKHLVLNPVYNVMEHLELLAEEIVPYL